MKKNLEVLMNEHQSILLVANAIQVKCAEMSSNNTLDIEFVNKSVDFIQNYADKFHHMKEEDLLFKSAEECLTHCNPIGQMLHEHNVGRELISLVKQGLEKSEVKVVVFNLLEYVDLIDSHIYKEDHILYQMFDEEMTTELDDELYNRYKEIELTFNVDKYFDFVKECKEYIRAA